MKPSQLLSKRGAWVQGVMAKDANNRGVGPENKDAIKFCVLGAIYHCYPKYSVTRTRAIRKLREAIGHLTNFGIAVWNDDHRRTKREVIAALKKAGL